ncbi:hypothetical protein [Promicromonospora sp. NPDC050262]|uniref:hypothetical protein n=1 Tax=Promicromonospora sp. NPDC050262 TaxID=3155036 RepID=UPI0034046AFD
MIVDGQRLSKEQLRAVRRAFASLPKDLKADLRRAQREQVGQIWKREMDAARMRGDVVPQQRDLFAVGTRVRAGLPIVLVAGGSRRRMRGGGSPADLARPMEFGTARRQNRTRYFMRTPAGRVAVTRHAARQLRLTRRSGYVVHPAVSQTIPQVIGLWVTQIAGRLLDATQGRTR